MRLNNEPWIQQHGAAPVFLLSAYNLTHGAGNGSINLYQARNKSVDSQLPLLRAKRIDQ